MSDDQFQVHPPKGLGIYGRICVDTFGGRPLVIRTSEGMVLFEWSEFFGPLPININGAGKDLRARHPFWRAASLWNLQGQERAGNEAFWREPEKPVLKHLGGRNYLVVKDGEPGHDW